ncbi:MAG: site-specific integrase, partial [Desulfobacteraceae bacterium]|nr:site-specific integrase [Desulfobacteraceae bacterium]
VNGYLRHIKAALKYAVREGYMPKLPEIVMYRKANKTEAEYLERILTADEVKKVIKGAYDFDSEFGRYIEVLLWTGGRRREVLNLQWQGVNFSQNRLALEGKTGRRTVPLLDRPRIVLKAIKKDIGRVFPDWHPDTVSHWLKAVMVKEGIAGHRLHDLRHTCATFLLKSGVSIEMVQRILGHAQITTTQIYAKVMDDLLQTEARKLKFE